MTLEDIITFLCDETAGQTLTPMDIRRSVLLVYEMGMEAGRQEGLCHAPQDACVVHMLRAGAPLCWFSQEPPVECPEGHYWSSCREEVTCPQCQARQEVRDGPQT